MGYPAWQLLKPVSAIVFDCDGTLTSIEGIDELAKFKNVEEKVKAITASAMGSTGLNPEIYQKRLELIQPRQEHINLLAKQYCAHQVPDAKAVINLLSKLNKEVYVVSAGLFPAVNLFCKILEVPAKNIFAVDIEFDNSGNFLGYETHSPLIHNHGKRDIISQLKKKHNDIIYIGDGLNDYAVHDLVTRFIGFGGAFYRKNIEAACQFYIRPFSLSPLLALTLTQSEIENLSETEKLLYKKGLEEISKGTVRILK